MEICDYQPTGDNEGHVCSLSLIVTFLKLLEHLESGYNIMIKDDVFLGGLVCEILPWDSYVDENNPNVYCNVPSMIAHCKSQII